jgi:hopanoid C-2 methylase
VIASWSAAIGHAYTPEALFERFLWNLRHTYPNRISPPVTRARLNARNLRRALVMLAKIVAEVGLFGDYRAAFWRFAVAALRAGRLAELIAVALVAHHMIRFARECGEGRQNASFYTDRPKAAADEPAAA